MTKKKEKLFTENFDPMTRLKQSMRDDGFPAYEPYMKNGVYAMNEQGHLVLVPRMHLDANAYREWFANAFPDGRVEVVRHTSDSAIFEGKVINPPEVMEVRLYANATDTYPKSNGFGRAGLNDSEEYDALATALSNAFKNAMRNMGCGTDILPDDYLSTLPTYIELEQDGKVMFFPQEANQLLQPGQLTAELRGESSQQEVKTTRTKKGKETAPAAEVPADVEKMQTASELPPAPPKEPEVKQGQDGGVEDVLAFLAAREAAKEAEDVPQDKPAEPADEALNTEEPKGEAADHEPAVAEPAKTPAAPNEMSNHSDTSVETEPKEISSDGDDMVALAKTVVFCTLDDADAFSQFNGMTVGDILQKNKNIIRYIARPTFHWQSKLPEHVYRAVMTVAEAAM